MKLLENMSIKKKLSIPLLFQLVLLAVLVFFFLRIRSRVASAEAQQVGLMDLSTIVRQVSNDKDLFLRGQMTFDSLEKDIAKVLQKIDSLNEERLDAMKPILGSLSTQFSQIDGLMKSNADLEKQMFALLDVSITQSNQYILGVAQRLADRVKRASVTDLERLVIIGANNNTTASFEIKTLFYRMKEDVSQSDKLETFLEEALKNAGIDKERLKNTPFAQLPVEAEKALLTIKENTRTFKENFQRIVLLNADIRKVTDNLLKDIDGLNADASHTVFAGFIAQLLTLFFFIAAISVLSLLTILTVTRLIVSPIAQTRDMLAEISSGEGDLRGRLGVDGQDEIADMARNYNRFAEQIETIIEHVKSSTVDVLNATREIAVSSSDLASRTNQQAAVTTETSATIEEFSAVVRSNTENAANLNGDLTSLNTEMQNNMVLVNEVTKTMDEIHQSSKEIDNIIDVIKDISFQTNLLALNAAVEAARAGEAGRGFAVVAAEVRNLAQKTAESSKTIQEIVSNNVRATGKGTELVNKTSQLLMDVIEALKDAVEKIAQISNSSSEQANGVEQISHSVNQIEDVTNQNAALVEELSATSSSMEQTARQLQDLVGRFKTSADSGDKKTKEELSGAKAKKKEKSEISLKMKTGEKKDAKKTPTSGESSASQPKEKKDADTLDDFFGGEDGFEEF